MTDLAHFERAERVQVSVLMPMRDAGPFLADAVESILGQSHRDLELLVIDDGSVDGSREYVAALPDSRVRLLDGPRDGISACLNLGLAHARGDLVMRCDSDDAYPPGRVAAQVAFMESRPDYVAVCGPFSMTGPAGEHVSAPRIEPSGAQEDVAPELLSNALRTHLCTFAFRRSALPRAGSFRKFFQTAEDIDFMLRLATTGPIGFLPANAYVYRLHDASITHSQTSVLRLFFEATAYALSRERLSTGSDALSRGETIALPQVDPRHAAADPARLHISRLLIGEAWKNHRAGDRRGALQAAWRAVRANPGYRDAWKSLLLVGVRSAR